jgi:hypothetical protein
MEAISFAIGMGFSSTPSGALFPMFLVDDFCQLEREKLMFTSALNMGVKVPGWVYRPHTKIKSEKQLRNQKKRKRKEKNDANNFSRTKNVDKANTGIRSSFFLRPAWILSCPPPSVLPRPDRTRRRDGMFIAAVRLRGRLAPTKNS